MLVEDELFPICDILEMFILFETVSIENLSI